MTITSPGTNAAKLLPYDADKLEADLENFLKLFGHGADLPTPENGGPDFPTPPDDGNGNGGDDGYPDWGGEGDNFAHGYAHGREVGYEEGFADGMDEIFRFALAEYGLATLRGDLEHEEDRIIRELLRRMEGRADLAEDLA